MCSPGRARAHFSGWHLRTRRRVPSVTQCYIGIRLCSGGPKPPVRAGVQAIGDATKRACVSGGGRKHPFPAGISVAVRSLGDTMVDRRAFLKNNRHKKGRFHIRSTRERGVVLRGFGLHGMYVGRQKWVFYHALDKKKRSVNLTMPPRKTTCGHFGHKNRHRVQLFGSQTRSPVRFAPPPKSHVPNFWVTKRRKRPQKRIHHVTGWAKKRSTNLSFCLK